MGGRHPIHHLGPNRLSWTVAHLLSGVQLSLVQFIPIFILKGESTAVTREPPTLHYQGAWTRRNRTSTCKGDANHDSAPSLHLPPRLQASAAVLSTSLREVTGELPGLH